MEQQTTEHTLTEKQLEALRGLVEKGEAWFSSAAASTTINRLATYGYVERRRHETEYAGKVRRHTTYHVTPAGLEKLGRSA
jgi:DNA-binding MarR family transcriptional regulator